MKERSYAEPCWGKRELGLQLVSPEGESYFLYSAPLITLWYHQGRYVRVKRRNRDAAKAIAYHPGEIYGALDRKDGMVRIDLFFGPSGRDMGQDPVTQELTPVVFRQDYILPEEELGAYVRAIELTLANRSRFEELMRYADCLSPYLR